MTGEQGSLDRKDENWIAKCTLNYLFIFLSFPVSTKRVQDWYNSYFQSFCLFVVKLGFLRRTRAFFSRHLLL